MLQDHEQILCAGCGEPLENARSFRVSTCTYCGETNLICTDNSVPRFVVGQSINEMQAIRGARSAWREEKSVNPAFLSELKDNSTCHLYFVPVYANEGLATVRYMMKKYRTEQRNVVNSQGRYMRLPGEGKVQEHTVRYDTRIVINSFHNTGPAVKQLRWGIEYIDIKSDCDVSMVDLADLCGQGTVLTPNISWDEFEVQHRRIGARDVESEREIVIQEPRLIYYPVWRVMTRWKNQAFDTFICAATGTFLQGTAPQSIRDRATAFSISFTITAMITSLCLVVVIELFKMLYNDMTYLMETVNATTMLLSIPLMLLIALLSAIAAYGWDKLRFTPEIIKSAVSTEIVSVDKVADTWLDKLWKSTLDRVSQQLDHLIN